MLHSLLVSAAIFALAATLSIQASLVPRDLSAGSNGAGVRGKCKLVDCEVLTVVEPACATRNDVLWALVAFNSSSGVARDTIVSRGKDVHGQACYQATTGVSALMDRVEVLASAYHAHLFPFTPEMKGAKVTLKHTGNYRGATLWSSLVPFSDVTPNRPPSGGQAPYNSTRLTVTVSKCRIPGDFVSRVQCLDYMASKSARGA